MNDLEIELSSEKEKVEKLTENLEIAQNEKSKLIEENKNKLQKIIELTDNAIKEGLLMSHSL